VLLQDPKTRRYLDSNDGWSEDPGRARVFAGLNEARRHGVAARLQLRIVALFGGTARVALANPRQS